MLSAILFLALVALLAYALERNHRRGEPGTLWPPLNGSTDIQDRDTERTRADLRAAAR
jgi:hypothetical protein